MLKIIVPSAGRFDTLTTNISGQILVVPNEEIELYKENNCFEIIGHPKLKNLAEKRNWILDKFDEDLFMIDDDALNFVSVFDTFTRDKRNLTPEKTREIIEKNYFLSKELGVFLYGFGESPVPIQYNGLKPMHSIGTMCGGAYGINKGGKLKFNTNTTACDSHWINLLNIYLNEKCLIDKRFSIEFQETFKTSGGQASKRTLLTEKKDTFFLRMQFGEVVELRKNSRNKQNHEWQRSLKFMR